MNSLMYKLAGVFLAISLIPLVIGINGTLAVQTAESALNANNRALQNLSRLLASADKSLTDNVQLQNRADQIINRVAAGQQETSLALQNMADSMLPRSFAVARMRYSLSEVAQGERALLLAMNMRYLVGDELEAARSEQLENIRSALERLDDARNSYLSLLRPTDDKKAWDAFELALLAWRESHNEFIAKIEELNILVNDLVRGGPVFAKASQSAYDTLFGDGKSVRDECEKRILDLNQDITATANASVRQAVALQSDTRTRVESLTRDYGASSSNVGELQSQFAEARAAADRAAENAAEALASTSRRFWYMALFSAVGVLIALAVGIILSWRITRPVRNMVTHMSRLAQGDLTADIPESDRRRNDEIGQLARGLQDVILANREEIRTADAMAGGDYTRPMPLRSEHDQLGRALASMLRHTNDALTKVVRATGRVGNGAAAVSEASRTLSQGAQTSAAAVEEISQTVASVDRQAQDNAAQAMEANQLATASRDAAQRGYSAVTELVAAMGEIQQSGSRIATVAKLIDDIAFQTNLLALNAAVEAARAGRQGRGFSVVADEVRNLSGRSAKAARETGEMVSAMAARMEAGAQLATRTDQELREIVEATARVAKIFEEITHSSNAQSSAMAQISQGLNQIDQVIQENTTSADSSAASSLALARQAEELRRMVSRFKLVSVKVDSHGNTIVRHTQTRGIEKNGEDRGRKMLPGPASGASQV